MWTPQLFVLSVYFHNCFLLYLAMNTGKCGQLILPHLMCDTFTLQRNIFIISVFSDLFCTIWPSETYLLLFLKGSNHNNWLGCMAVKWLFPYSWVCKFKSSQSLINFSCFSIHLDSNYWLFLRNMPKILQCHNTLIFHFIFTFLDGWCCKLN